MVLCNDLAPATMFNQHRGVTYFRQRACSVAAADAGRKGGGRPQLLPNSSNQWVLVLFDTFAHDRAASRFSATKNTLRPLSGDETTCWGRIGTAFAATPAAVEQRTLSARSVT
jgi:hypothetical protein